MTALTIYTGNYDQNEFIVNGGMSGKVFLDIDNLVGVDFKNLDEALDYCDERDINVDRIDFNYVSKDGVQMFRKFKVDD